MEADRLILAVAVVAVLVGTLMFSNPSITGYVPTAVQSQSLNLEVEESQRFVIEAPSGISSFAISGSVEGRGLVNVYLASGEAKWLVYSNKRKAGSSMERITGMSYLDITPGEKLDEIESVPSGYGTVEGSFVHQCLETCVLDESLLNEKTLYLDVVVEPGAALHISEIHFAG